MKKLSIIFNKTRGKSLLLMFLLLSAIGTTNVMAQNFTEGDLNYSVNEDGTTVTLTGHFYGTNAIGTLSIPNEVTYNYQTYPVTAVGNNAFKNCIGLTGSLVIPNSVTTIGDYAFQGCSAMQGSLTIGTSVTAIGILAFGNCGFSTVNYNATACPSVPYDLGQYAVFEGCSSLETLNIGNNVQIIPDNMFRECSGFTGNLVLPNSLTTIGQYAFEGLSNLTGSLTIPNSVTTIGQCAFNYCSGFTGDLTIGNSVTSIGNSAFYGCSGFSGALTIGASVNEIGIAAFGLCYDFTVINLNATNWAIVGGYLNGDYQNPFYAYYNQIGPTNAILNIGENVQIIPERAFAGCSGLTGSVTIPNSVTTIGNSAFSGCSGFTGDLTIGNSVTSIGNSAFSNCSGFTRDLTIPNSVTSIGEYAFSYCSGFTGTLTIPNSVTTIVEWSGHSSAFWGCCNLETIIVEAGNTAYDSRDNCNALIKTSTNELLLGCKNTVIPNSVTTIGWNAFYGCSGMIGSLIIPNSVTSIGGFAFYGCSGLTSLTIGNSVTSIELSSFTDCIGLTSIQVLAGTPPNTQGYGSFGNIDYSIPVTVPCGSSSAYQNTYHWNFFTNIQEYCDPLTYSINDDGVSVTVTGHVDGTAATGELVIPETKTIDGVTYTVTEIGNYAFSGCSGLTGDLVIPNTVTAIGNSAFQSCGGFTGSLTIGNSVTTIGNNAFRNCMGFTGSLVIPDSVTSIGGYTFMNCTGFTGNLIIGNSVTTIGTLAFACQYGGNYSGSLVIPNSVTTIGTGTFMNCSGLTGNLDIPSSITSMNSSFNGCSGFTSITLHWDIPISGCSIGSVNYEIPLIVPCGSASLYRYNPNWRYFSDIQEDCSGMYAVSATVNPTEGGSVVFRRVGETLLSDSFEEYTVGNTIATESVAAGHDWWNTWDSNPGGEKDGLVAEYDGSQCGHFTYGNDQILLLGNKESGIYDLEFDILVPDGKNAFFSILHQFDNGSANEAVKFHLHVSNSYDPTITPGQGVVTVGYSNIVSYIPCVYDAWMHFRVHIDIDADLARFYYTNSGEEELFLCQWQWSLGGQPGYGTLAAMDFWPPKDAETSEYFVDNISLKQLGDGTSKGYDANIQIVSEEASNERGAVRTSKYFAPGSICTLTAIPDENYVFTNWTENDEEISTETSYIFTVNGNRNLVANFVVSGDSNHNYVDLGLPSGLLWATCNVGANSPEDYGDYFAWGETQPKDTYDLYTYQYCMGSYNTLTKYCNNSSYGYNGFTDNLTTLLPEDDAATANWGEDWRMPTHEEWQELLDNTTSTWTTQNGVNGRLFTASNGNSLFLPAAGCRYGSSLQEVGFGAEYWSSSLGANPPYDHPGNAWIFSSGMGGYSIDGYPRDFGQSVRPVRSASQIVSFDINATANPVEGGLVTGAGTYPEGNTCTLTATANAGYAFINWTENGEVVSTDATYSFTVTESATYVANFIQSQGEITQVSDLAQGWNWWSTYVEQDGIDGLAMLEESLGTNGYQIKSQTDFVTNYGSMWFGMLSSINNEQTYMIDNTSSCQVVMTGAPVTPSDHPITVSSGWNWTGYPCTNTMSVSEAFSGYTPANGDQVKSQSDYAIYYSGMWIGQLQSITPGTGLMYLSNNATSTTLIYPDGGRSAEAPASSKAMHWTNDIHAYPHNMTVMAVVELDDVELTTDNYELSAFDANGECRGSAKLVYVEPLDRHVAFLTIAGDDAVELSFRLFDAENGTEYADAEETLSYTVNAIVGDVDDLYVVHFRGTTGMDEFANSIQIFPNPVQAGERISINTADEAKSPVRVEIVNVLGVETLRATSEQTPAMVTAPSGAGVYTMRITVEGKGTVVRKLVVR